MACKIPQVAICITGASRTLPAVAENIWKSHIAAIGEDCVDTYVLIDTSKSAQGRHFSIPNNYTKYRASVKESIVMLRPIISIVTDLDSKALQVSFKRSRGTSFRIQNATRAMPYSIKRTMCEKNELGKAAFVNRANCWTVAKEHERDRGVQYAWVLQIRTDISYEVAMPAYTTWPVPPSGPWTRGLACTEQLGHCMSPMAAAAALEDQWGLVSRAAADTYFLGPAILQQVCPGSMIEDACSYNNSKGERVIANLYQGCMPWRPQTRLGRPLNARNTSLCEMPFVPAGNKHVVRKLEMYVSPPRFYLKSFGDFGNHSSDWRARYAFYPNRKKWSNTTDGMLELKIMDSVQFGRQPAEESSCASAIQRAMTHEKQRNRSL